MIADQITIRKRIFQFIRLARWEDMKLITIIVRFYWDYQKEVFYCFSEKNLATNVRLNKCIEIKTYIEAEVMLGMVTN